LNRSLERANRGYHRRRHGTGGDELREAAVLECARQRGDDPFIGDAPAPASAQWIDGSTSVCARLNERRAVRRSKAWLATDDTAHGAGEGLEAARGVCGLGKARGCLEKVRR
jgi:hypothetical protein